MSDHHFHVIPDTIAVLATLVLNYITWTGVAEAFEVVQKIATCVVTIAMIVYYVYGIMEKRKSINGKPRRR